MTMSGEIPSLVDLQNTKVRIDHFAELIDGTPSGTSTNPLTGVIHPTYEQAIKDLGFKPGSGSFTTGFTINPGEYDLAWYDPVSNNWYSWNGTLPKVVAAGTNPAASTGWTNRTDATFRSEVASGVGSLIGYKAYPTSMQSNLHDRLKYMVNVVTDYGADNTGATSATAAIQNAVNSGAKVVPLS